MKKISGFNWDKENEVHISEHNVTPEEAEEAIIETSLILKGKDGRYLGYGKTSNGRHLFVVFILKPKGIARIITARAMTAKERRFYQKKYRKERA